MTTPAISKNAWRKVTGHTVSCSNTWNPQCNAPATYAGSYAEWIAESRPQSVTHKKSASGWRSPGSWSHTGSHLRYPEAPVFQNQVSLQGKNWWTRTYYDYASWNQSVWALPSFPSKLEDLAVNKALARLKAKRPNVNLSVAFGERREAADMMADRVASIAKSVRRFRHLRPREWGQVIKHGTKNELRNIPGSWLEVQYGWKPLMSDVHSACQALNKREQSQDAYRASVKGVVQEKSTAKWIKTSGVSSRFQFQTEMQISAVSVVRLHYLLRNPFIQTLASLGITNPLELVWELVPYSFVVDWFLPVGNYLQLLDADFGWDFKTGTMTRYQRGEGSGPLVLVDGRPYDRVIQGQIALTTYRHTRTLVTSSPWPRLPHIKNPLSLGHVANAMSLLVQAFK